MRQRLALPLLLFAALAVSHPAHAAIEEFDSFDVLAPEIDDESAIDYFLCRQPENWRAEWDTVSAALRADQGCLTAGIWYQANDIKARARMGARSWLDLGFTQHTDPAGSYEWLQFDFMHDTRRIGALGVRFRPSYDKSTQDFALLWALGDTRSRWQARAAFSIEDTFNRLWTFRQVAVGETRLQPYRRHPFEPSVELAWRGEHHRLEISDTWLLPMRQDVIDPDSAISGTRTLHGNHGRLLAECDVAGWTPFMRYEVMAARSTRTNLASPGDGRVDRQQWSVEAGARRTLGERLVAEARYVYQSRSAGWRPPIALGTFRALDRIAEAEATWLLPSEWRLRAGLLYDRIGIERRGNPPGFTYGSRKESRAFVGIEARLGTVRFRATECVELDAEPYEVSFHHDKGFLHLQTTF